MEHKEIQFSKGSLIGQLSELNEDQLSKILEQSNKWADYTKYTGMMNGIAHEMKEVPEIPSEQPKEANALQRVEFPEEGGVLTYMEGFKYPYLGYPHYNFVDKIDSIKKNSRAFVSGIYHQVKRKNRLWLITLIPSIWFLKDIVHSWIYVNFRLIDRVKIKELRYSKAVREVYRAFDLGHPQPLREQIRDLLCMVLEMDNAYRFRFQDIIPEVNKDILSQKPIKEIIRLLNILQSREKVQEVKDTWTLMKYLVRIYLTFDKELREVIVNGIYAMNLQAIELSTNDKEFCIPRKDYTFGFQINPNEEDQKLIKLNDLKEELKNEQKRIKEESTKEHQSGGDMGELDAKYEKLLKDAQERYEKQTSNVMGLL